MKRKNTVINSLTGLIYYFLTVVLGLLNRRVLVQIMGGEYQGINGLFSNLLTMLSIAELGIGSAIIYHLYEPLVQNDKEKIKSLMWFYKRCYFLIAIVMGVFGLAVMPFLKYIVTDVQMSLNLPYIYFWYLLDVVVSYLFTYKRSILIADQKNYIVLICDIFYQIICKLSQIIILIVTHNFILYLIVMVLCRAVENIFINYISTRRYPYLKDKQINPIEQNVLDNIRQKVKGAFCHKIGEFFVLSTDNILISKFVGILAVGVYSNYNLVFTAFLNAAMQLVSAATASVGHVLVEKNQKKNMQIFSQLQLINAAIMNCAAVVIFCLITPFLEWVFGSENVLNELVVLLLTIRFYLFGMRKPYAVFKEASGVLYEDRWIPILESLINIGLSLYLVQRMGMVGIIIGTVSSSLLVFVYTYPFLVYRNILCGDIRNYAIQLGKLFGIMLLGLLSGKILTTYIFEQINFFRLVIGGCVCVIISNVLFYFLYASKLDVFDLLIENLKGLIIKK